MRPLFYLAALSIGFTGCKQSAPVAPSADGLTGTWIEKSARKDTIIFNLDQTGSSSANTLLVNRGREINPAGYLAPKLGSGFYRYYLKGDTISVYDMYASTIYYAPFYIEQKGNELYLDNFFEVGFRHPATATRTLVRLTN
ncbi:hypothetical protein [Spirosoma foliorum]|uniref:Lipoprotein n=1 Tax=Spirosoma foliorum TaxID=2710596 RepID=A0A7G5H5X2_9BACT|nr:hypothetical protein [Spirosoma foliorum]QMW06514.1 hypothetical protein H3H32_17260 [Spirosoma foliorum]